MPCTQIPKKTIPAAVTIGNFDGVHLGHQSLLAATIAHANQHGLASVAITFDPHPVFVLARPPQKTLPPLPRLTDIHERIRLLKAYGVSDVIVLPFTLALASMTPAEFFKRILCDHIPAQALFLGHDFALGKNRSGSVAELLLLGNHMDIATHQIEAVCYQAMPVSSTRIRESLLAGDAGLAAALLGRPYRLTGMVVHGEGRGKSFGIPTANITNISTLIPQCGVYITQAQYTNKQGVLQNHRAVTNIGIKPTFKDSTPPPLSIETHILDTHADLYGCELRLDFITRLRSEQAFSSIEALLLQIHKDIAASRTFIH